MRYDFDAVIDRRGTASVKWDLTKELFGADDLLPLWVADMDFAAPPEVLAALHQRVDHGIFGYTANMPDYYAAVAGWFKRRHNWQLEDAWLLFCPGIVIAIDQLVQLFTAPGDGVIIQPPVYHPFRHIITDAGRTVVNNPLILDAGRYVMDYTLLEEQARDPKTTMLLLCNPHNPGGRVWTKEELQRAGEICLAHNVLVVSDEIHCDLVYRGRAYAPFGSISRELLQNAIICTSPGKTFNLAGLQVANLVIADPVKRAKLETRLRVAALDSPSPLGLVAAQAAYRHGNEWLDQLLEYLSGNVSFLREFVRAQLPRLTVIEPEGTYLVWVDCRALQLPQGELRRLLIEKGRVAFSAGKTFGQEGAGFIRINIACPRAILTEGLNRLHQALQ